MGDACASAASCVERLRQKPLKKTPAGAGDFLYRVAAALAVVHDAPRRRTVVHGAMVYPAVMHRPVMDRTVMHGTVRRRVVNHVMPLRCRRRHDGWRGEGGGQGETSRKKQAFHGNPPLGNCGQLDGFLLNEDWPKEPAVWLAGLLREARCGRPPCGRCL